MMIVHSLDGLHLGQDIGLRYPKDNGQTRIDLALQLDG